jgi:2,3-bisphosphoglycerate-independent phosphoglycerate mutase
MGFRFSQNNRGKLSYNSGGVHILLLFVDGYGLGDDESSRNPLFSARTTTLYSLFGQVPVKGDGHYQGPRAVLVPTDATLGVSGIPQSGTGQTTIFTGVNAPAAIGMHSGPYPNATLREIIGEGNLFQRMRAAGLRVELGNAYPPVMFDRLARKKARRTAIMQAALSAGVRLRDIHDLQEGNAISAMSISNRLWREHGASVPVITERQAGRNLMRLAQRNDFTAFEYFLTDVAGHKNDHEWILEVLGELDEFWGGAIDELDPDETLLIITSDHGNIEDWSFRGHTLNPVPTILVGARRDEIAPYIHSLVDIAPAITSLLTRPAENY